MNSSVESSIVLGGGCFWCIEAIYLRVVGVTKVTSGYAGGDTNEPTYHDHGNHAEVVKIEYDNSKIDLDTILEIFFYVHDPTTINRQGNDVGEQYRSIILCSSENDKTLARQVLDNSRNLWSDPIVTEIKILQKFYEAEDYHQDYFNQNQSNPYCQVIINPKIAKFESKFKQYLKSDSNKNPSSI
jgi:methionine-S-sulfoxide reductase